jgi:hypothetical protein
MRVTGDAGSAQAGVVDCYLKYLATGDRSGLASVMAQYDLGPGYRITDADLRHSADARRGVPKVALWVNRAAPNVVFVTIRYADGAVEHKGLVTEDTFGLTGGWKIQIGSSPHRN